MKAARFLIPALAAAGILVPAVFSAALPDFSSTTRSFSFDGRRYTLEPSRESDFSLVRRELEKAGVDLPPDPDEDPAPPHPALSFALAEEGKDRFPRRLPIPASFVIDHTLRLANDGGEVEIAFGGAPRSSMEPARILRAGGWSCSRPDDRIRGGTVATCTRGKEKILAFLEANGGGFLLVRLVDR